MKFIYQYEESAPRIEFTLSPDSTLTDAVEEFELFLKAAGYNFDKHLEFVGEETENVEA